MSEVESKSTASLPGVGAKALIGLAAVAAVAFVVLAAFPYRAFLGSQEAARQTLEDFQFIYWEKRGWLLVHIAAGLVALLSGPVQLWLGLHKLKMNVHRKLGALYIAGVAVGSIAAIALAVQTDFGLIFGSGLFFLALAWISTTSMAFVALRRGLVTQHREWMIRSYVVTFAFVVFRIGQIALVELGVPILTAIGIMAWAAWAVPLPVTELAIQAGKFRKLSPNAMRQHETQQRAKVASNRI
jgi:hypothetical protein